jgi:hypothetical protein
MKEKNLDFDLTEEQKGIQKAAEEFAKKNMKNRGRMLEKYKV